MLAGAGERSDWVQNLRADPAVTVRVRDVTYSAHVRVIEDQSEERIARDLVFEKYQTDTSGDLRGWRESALPVALDIIDPELPAVPDLSN
jgi:F420H(2)-dependent quinone reductase